MSDAPNYRKVNEKLLRAVLRADYVTVTEFYSLSEEMRHQAWLSAWSKYQYNVGQSTASGQLIHSPRRPAIETSELENSEASFTSKEPSRSVPDENKVPDIGKIPQALGSLPPSIPETIETESEEIDELFAEWWELHGDNLDSAPDPAAIWPDCSSRILDEIRSRISIARSGKLNRFLADSDSSNAYFENSFSMSNLPLLEAGYHPIPGSHWKLVRRLDGGNTGFGVVWEGRNDRLGSRGVFKFCKDPLDDSTVAALHNELQKVHKLSHPGIVRVQNEHLDAEIPFLVFEYVEGIDLGRFLHRYFGPQPDGSPGKPLSIDNAASVILKLAEIVAYAHSNNVVHRDLKPANILVANSDELALLRALKVQSHLACSDLKVIDFGIGGHSRGERGTTIFQQSLGRQFDGFRTLMYASPEQCRGDAAEKSDDVYALGVIWYQLLAGDIHQPLPHGQHWHEGLLDVRAGHSEDLTAEQIALLNACLAHKKTNRIVDAVALKDRIREVYPNVPASQTFLDVLRHAVGNACNDTLTVPDLRKLPAKAATILCSQRVKGKFESFRLNDLTELSAETAAELAEESWLGSLELNGVTSLCAETAAELAKGLWWKTLELNGVTSLSAETAAELAKGTWRLKLNGVTSLSVETAAKLAKGRWEDLELNGLTSLSVETAAELAKGIMSKLQLNNLTSLSAEIAAEFAKGQWEYLELNGLSSLSVETAAEFAKGKFKFIKLNGVTSLNVKIAAEFVKGKFKRIELNGLTSLSVNIAAELAKGRWGLKLNGVTSLSVETAAEFAGAEGWFLELNGLSSVNMETAAELAKGQWGYLGLNGLSSLNVETAAELAKGQWEQFDVLGQLVKKCWRTFALNGVTSLSVETAAELGKGRWEDLELNGLTSLSAETAVELAKMKRVELQLNGVTSLSVETAAELAKLKVAQLQLNGVTSLSAETAAELAKGRWELFQLNGLTSLSVETAAALAKGRWTYFSLNGVTSLSAETAVELAKGRWYSCHFNGLTSLSSETAADLDKAGWW